jgi:hypothetical protein
MSGLTHAFVSAKADGTDATKVRKSNWNDLHLFTGGAVGNLLTVGAASAITSLADVAVGSVLVSGGVGVAPAWSASPSVTGLTLSTPLDAGSGGTGANLAAFVVGDLLYATSTTALAKLAAVATGSVLVSAGTGTAPAWSATPTSLTSVGFSGGSVLNGATSNVIEQRNSTTAQTFRLYNTYTDASNYERLTIDWLSVAANVAYIGTTKLGTGSSRILRLDSASDLQFATSNTPRFFLDAGTGGHFKASSDDTYDIGATNANRPRNLHISGYAAIKDGITAPGAGTGEARIYVDTADGDLKVVFADGVIKTIVVDT